MHFYFQIADYNNTFNNNWKRFKGIFFSNFRIISEATQENK